MNAKAMRRALGMLLIFGAGAHGAAGGVTSQQVYRALGLKTSDVISGTVVTAKVVTGSAERTVSLVTYFTGRKEEAQAINVRLDVWRAEGETLTPIYSRDYGEVCSGPVGRGELEVVDLDGDGTREIVVTYDDAREPLIRQRRGEILLHEPEGFRVVWAGVMEYDATRAAREVPLERRDRFEREIDVKNTLRTHGITLFLTKTMIAVAGERLPAPKVVQETFALRPEPEN